MSYGNETWAYDYLQLYWRRKRFAEMGYTKDETKEDPLLLYAFDIIECEYIRMREKDRQRKKRPKIPGKV